MAKQTIDIGTSANKGDGDPLRTAFRKINENFTELYAANGDADGAATSVLPSADATYDLGSAAKQWADIYVADFIYLNGSRIEVTTGGALLVDGGAPAEVQDTVGSVFGDDSTLLVDGVNNTIPSANISGTEASNWNTAYLWGDHSAAGYAPQATTYTKVEVDAAIAAVDPFSGDVTGSVFADDSTLLVDGVNGKITGEVTGTISSTNWMASSDGYLTIANGGATGPGPIQIVASANLDLTAGAGQVINANRKIVAAGGVKIDVGVEEKFATLTGSTGTVTHDCDTGHIFYHTTPAADWTANFTNLDLTAEYATTLSIVIAQGATAYIPTAVQIGGVAQTILWQGGSQPSGTADGTDVVAFSVLNDGGTYIVMGQLVGFS